MSFLLCQFNPLKLQSGCSNLCLQESIPQFYACASLCGEKEKERERMRGREGNPNTVWHICLPSNPEKNERNLCPILTWCFHSLIRSSLPCGLTVASPLLPIFIPRADNMVVNKMLSVCARKRGQLSK